MKRFAFALFLAIAFCPVLASADENVSAVQTKLRQEGFYFGDVTGNYSDDTSAAITRYQIRRGLQITGELDEATAKALGVRPLPAAGPASTHSLSGTWRQLRSGEQQFVPAQPTPNAAPNASAIPSDKPTTTRQPKPATTRLPPVPPPVERRANEDPLGPDRLRDYVAAFILAGREPRVAAELEFFADRVDYFDDGKLSRARIRRDLQHYDALWPDRQFSLAGDVETQPTSDGRVRISFPLRYHLRNGAKRASGTVRKTLVLQRTQGNDLEIVAVKEKKMR